MPRVLIVDDSPTETYKFKETLEKHGFEIISADNGADGVAVARQEQPDVVLMDVVMPGLNGFQATRQLSKGEDTKHIPVIIVTTKDQETDKVSVNGRNEVVLPAYTCPSLVKVILEAALQPRLVDIDARSMVMRADDLAAAIGQRTLAVIVVHPFGMAHDIEPAQTLAQPNGAVLIEDVAQSMGARFDGRLAGTRGHYGLFSLGPGKPLSAGGGGIVCAVRRRRRRQSLRDADAQSDVVVTSHVPVRQRRRHSPSAASSSSSSAAS